jgi:hypothetical protein
MSVGMTANTRSAAIAVLMPKADTDHRRDWVDFDPSRTGSRPAVLNYNFRTTAMAAGQRAFRITAGQFPPLNSH